MTLLEQIPSQVKLPLSVAVGVVAQGIRIRLGRSVVTVTGVVLGIAFLMSTLTAQLLKRAVSEEDRLRERASRMYGYLVAESGTLFERPIAVVATKPTTPVEERLLTRLEREGISEVRWWSGGVEAPSEALNHLSPKQIVDAAELGKGARLLLVLGDGPLPSLDWGAVFASPSLGVLAITHERAPPGAAPRELGLVQLDRELSAEERAKLASVAEQERFRGLWIIVISLVVTVIGISNAMLMSTTERFREIGTMKCLGATSRFVQRLFLLEASFMGLAGGVVGVLVGALFAVASYLLLYGFSLIGNALWQGLPDLLMAGLSSLLASVFVSIVAGIYPAHVAASMVPAAALRSNV